MPCYNEERTICLLLDAIYAQTFPRASMEVVIADGLSTDQTRLRIADFQATHPDLAVRIVDNSLRVIPSALNRAIEAAQGEYIVRVDAHSIPDRTYVERSLVALQDGKGTSVGGVWKIHPGADTQMARAIALAAAHPLGVGDALYRIGGNAREVDTVPFGAFRRDLVEKIGLFDETLLTNEDYEFNVRIRQSGGRLWLDPSIQSIYFARTTLRALARQYLRYGYWKAQMLKRYPRTMRWRQFLPPAFVAGLTGLLLLSIWFSFARWLLLLQLALYSFALMVVGIATSVKEKTPVYAIYLPLAIATMHISWGAAFLWGIISSPPRKKPHDG